MYLFLNTIELYFIHVEFQTLFYQGYFSLCLFNNTFSLHASSYSVFYISFSLLKCLSYVFLFIFNRLFNYSKIHIIQNSQCLLFKPYWSVKFSCTYYIYNIVPLFKFQNCLFHLLLLFPSTSLQKLIYLLYLRICLF